VNDSRASVLRAFVADNPEKLEMTTWGTCLAGITVALTHETVAYEAIPKAAVELLELSDQNLFWRDKWPLKYRLIALRESLATGAVTLLDDMLAGAVEFNEKTDLKGWRKYAR
jgi:hypothetical protein